MAIELLKPTTNTTRNSRRDDRPDPEVWLNVGYTSKNEETGEDVFISVPVGIALDTMEPQPISGKNEAWRNLVQAKNGLLEALQEAAKGLEPGDEEIISDLTIQIRRKASTAAPDAGKNPHMAGLRNLSFAQTA